MKRLCTLLLCALAFAACEDRLDQSPDPARIGAFLFEQADPVLSAQVEELIPVFGFAQYHRLKTDLENGLTGAEMTPEQALDWFLPGATIRQEGTMWHILKDGVETVVETGGRSLLSDPEAVWTYRIAGTDYFPDELPSLRKKGFYACSVSLPERQNRNNFLSGELSCDISFLMQFDFLTGAFLGYSIENVLSGSGTVTAEALKIAVEITEPLERRSTDSRFRHGHLTLTARDGEATDIAQVEYGLETTWVYYGDYYKEYNYEQ